ncbi:SLAM family member 9-like [Notamacropus eugenii]|uniref:SLAM family member 9-like n=1 Tax=Notamacropus eugenii TaxID=9315 RepID=UPI003B67408F
MIYPRLWALFLLGLLLGPGGSKGIAGPGELVGIVGESITFPLEIMAGEKVESIAWISRTLVAVVYSEQGRKPANITLINPLYVGRLRVPTHSYYLEISSLKMEDAGSYKALITTQTCSVGTNKEFILRIHGEVQEH